jgi:hypothetical protein|tara:strand:- start:63 stop:461 length:399 start_codon:yes stop_codon:yes gene_type:complete
MKKKLIFLFLFQCLNGISQDLSKEHISELNSLNLKTDKLNLYDSNIQLKLNEILTLERERKRKKKKGIIYLSASVLFMASGIIASNSEKDLVEAGGIANIVTGGIIGGISIGMFSSSKKKEKKRDELIKLFE